MFRLTDVVKNLLIINVLMYLGTLLMGDPSSALLLELINEQKVDFSMFGRYQLAMYFPTSDYFKPFQLVTHMFMHSDPSHLFFNMFAIFMFGPSVEGMWGPKRFLVYYFVTGFGAMLLHLFVRYLEISVFHSVSPYAENVPMLGASGAVFGIMIAYAMLFPNNRIMLLFPPIPVRAGVLVLIFVVVELTMGLGGVKTGIAHFAHLGGALFGFLLILYWRKYGSRL